MGKSNHWIYKHTSRSFIFHAIVIGSAFFLLNIITEKQVLAENDLKKERASLLQQVKRTMIIPLTMIHYADEEHIVRTVPDRPKRYPTSFRHPYFESQKFSTAQDSPFQEEESRDTENQNNGDPSFSPFIGQYGSSHEHPTLMDKLNIFLFVIIVLLLVAFPKISSRNDVKNG